MTLLTGKYMSSRKLIPSGLWPLAFLCMSGTLINELTGDKAFLCVPLLSVGVVVGFDDAPNKGASRSLNGWYPL